MSDPKIVFEDETLIVVDKPAGLLTIATERERTATAYHFLTEHVRRRAPRRTRRSGDSRTTRDPRSAQPRIFIVHRLDRETSGLLVFAKTESAKRALQAHWNAQVQERAYVAVVHGVLRADSGTLKSRLAENRAYKVYSTNSPEGKLAITHYRVLARGNGFTLLELNLETGRKNQIRVQLQDLGHSVVGDKRYGGIGNPIHRLALHAASLVFPHPGTGEILRFESAVPSAFYRLLK